SGSGRLFRAGPVDAQNHGNARSQQSQGLVVRSLAKRTVNRYHHGMASALILDREEYIEQVYFFHTFRERLTQNFAAQEVLERLHEEILATTRLPLAIQFLATELKHTGELASGFSRLPHYFTPYQAYVIGQAEREGQRFSLPMALLI